MSLEEDTELRNLVAQTLENKGILPKIRAELRANVFLALEENINTKEALLKNEELSAFIQVPVGILILNLVREFLEFFSLDFTLSVFDPETKYGADYGAMPREKMIEELHIIESKKKGPLLYEIISRIVSDSKYGSKTDAKNDNNITLNNCNESLNGDSEIASPVLNLNTTYVKNKDDNGNSTPIDIINENNENNDSIEEELISNKSSESDNSSSDMNFKKVDQNEKILKSSFDKTDEITSFKPVPENSTEFDLLTFTPVKEMKAKENITSEKCKKIENEIKENSNSSSMLGDLPPLNAKTEPKKNKISEIKEIIDQGLNMDNYDEIDDNFHSSVSSKSSKNEMDIEEDSDSKYMIKQSEISQSCTSNKSERTDIPKEGNLDDDLSDFLNNHSSGDTQPLTVDETVSKLSNIGDHLESL